MYWREQTIICHQAIVKKKLWGTNENCKKMTAFLPPAKMERIWRRSCGERRKTSTASEHTSGGRPDNGPRTCTTGAEIIRSITTCRLARWRFGKRRKTSGKQQSLRTLVWGIMIAEIECGSKEGRRPVVTSELSSRPVNAEVHYWVWGASTTDDLDEIVRRVDVNALHVRTGSIVCPSTWRSIIQVQLPGYDDTVETADRLFHFMQYLGRPGAPKSTDFLLTTLQGYYKFLSLPLCRHVLGRLTCTRLFSRWVGVVSPPSE
jgi:hypothetical protein